MSGRCATARSRSRGAVWEGEGGQRVGGDESFVRGEAEDARQLERGAIALEASGHLLGADLRGLRTGARHVERHSHAGRELVLGDAEQVGGERGVGATGGDLGIGTQEADVSRGGLPGRFRQGHVGFGAGGGGGGAGHAQPLQCARHGIGPARRGRGGRC